MDVQQLLVDVAQLDDAAPVEVVVELAHGRVDVDVVDRDEFLARRVELRIDEQLQIVLEQTAEAFEDAAVHLA